MSTIGEKIKILKALNAEKKRLTSEEKKLKAEILKDAEFDKDGVNPLVYYSLMVSPKKSMSISNSGYILLHGIHQENFIHEPWPFKVKCEVIAPLLSECSKAWRFEINKQVAVKGAAPEFKFLKGNGDDEE